MSAKSSDFIDEHIGSRILIRRRALKISQTRLGREIGVSFQQFQKYENGKNRITAARLFVLAHVLDVEFSYFFEGLASPLKKRRVGNSKRAAP